MTRKLVLCLGVLGLSLTAYLTMGQAQEKAAPAPPPMRKIPGVTAEDGYPHGCVDCHINYVEMKRDTRFSTLTAEWSEKVEPGLLAKAQAAAPKGLTLRGKHPAVTAALKDIPAKCLVCHSKSSKTAPPFGDMMHEIHLTGGEQNFFLTIFQGECTYCHKLDMSTGHWTIPSGPEK
jgi:hypothetical protein